MIRTVRSISIRSKKDLNQLKIEDGLVIGRQYAINFKQTPEISPDFILLKKLDR